MDACCVTYKLQRFVAQRVCRHDNKDHPGAHKVGQGCNQPCSQAITSITDRDNQEAWINICVSIHSVIKKEVLTNEPCITISRLVKVQAHTAVLQNEHVTGPSRPARNHG